jgi:predicted ATPase
VNVKRRFNLAADPPTENRQARGPIVARDAENAALVEELEASAVGGRSVVIGGDAGMGKTALLESFLANARRRGVVVVEGACVEIESRRPFGAFADVLASCSRSFGPQRIERSLKERGMELRRLMTRGPNAPAVGDTGQERHLMHGSFLGLMEDLSSDGPLVLALEDLHWADEASLELWGYLSRRMRTRPFLLVATYRTDELGRLHPLRGLLAQLLMARAINSIALAPLDPEGTGALIRTRLALRDSSASDFRRFRDIVHEKCEGNPLHTEETLDVLRQSGRLAYLNGA